MSGQPDDRSDFDIVASTLKALGQGGPLAGRIPDYEVRAQQLDLARAVAEALRDEAHLDVEGPCGTGKTYAYLIPLILHCAERRARAIVCTANIALQEQLVRKDLPALAQILPQEFSFAILKGIGNYVCPVRRDEFASEVATGSLSGAGAGGADPDQVHRLLRWSRQSESGDRAHVPFSVESRLWSRMNGVAELCPGSSCPRYLDCPAQAPRLGAADVEIIVTNHHLVCADIAIRLEGGPGVLPAYTAAVVDEAHQLPDIARSSLGARVTRGSTFRLAAAARLTGVLPLFEEIRAAGARLFDHARQALGDRQILRLTKKGMIDAEPVVALLDEFTSRTQAALDVEESPRRRVVLERGVAIGMNLYHSLQTMVSLNDPNIVSWIEKDEDSVVLVSNLIDVTRPLAQGLYEGRTSVIMTSATLATEGGNFAFLRQERGRVKAREKVVGSPFDFAGRCRLLIPRFESASPKSPTYVTELAHILSEILRRRGGATMALFTSWRNLRACAVALGRERIPGIEILCQGDQPRSRLLEQFRSQGERSVLLATASFWAGVDIPGSSLTCLLIDKIPFATPEDPLQQAIEEIHRDAFRTHSLPRAIVELRQGFGRLIRTKSDYGIVVLCDPRVLTKDYGRRIQESLPSAPILRDLEEALEFVETMERRTVRLIEPSFLSRAS